MDGIRGTYKLGRKIETGGSATVWEASHLRTGRRVALKALHPHLVDNEVARSRFTSEADLMLGLEAGGPTSDGSRTPGRVVLRGRDGAVTGITSAFAYDAVTLDVSPSSE